MQKNIYGKRSEIIASDYLKQKGYKIIDVNYKNKVGEIDVIAKDKECLVFVEVKARVSQQFGHPLEAVNTQKQQKIRAVAGVYLMKCHMLDAECRFDVVSILGVENLEIEHIVDAF